MKSTLRLFALTLLVTSCGPVAKSDPAFWDPADDVGGKLVDYGNPGGGVPSYGGAPPPGSGGSYSYGGSSPGTGSIPNYGAGGSFPYGGTTSGGGSSPYGAGGGSPYGTGGSDPFGAGGSMPPPNAGGAPPAGNSGPCNFSFTVTTVTAHGQFAPRNVGALWIEDAGGKFVKSLEVWGAQRLPNLTAWVSVSGNNTVDAITSATLSSHRQHADHWDCSDVNRQPVVNGNYQACVSFTESDAIPFFGPPPIVTCVPFQKGAGPFSTNPPDVTNFVGWSLVMQ